VLGDPALLVHPDDVHGSHRESLPGGGHARNKPALIRPPVVALIATRSPAATMSWISAVMSGEASKKMRYESIAPFLSGVVPGKI
jgi:hypothetical protein